MRQPEPLSLRLVDLNMSDLTPRERRKLEELFSMGSGYVLKFSDRTMAEFFAETSNKDINLPCYQTKGTSKANRLRSFWEQEPNGVVVVSLSALIEHGGELNILDGDEKLLATCQAIVTRLSMDQPVADIDAISASNNERDFEAVAKAARDSIEKNQPEEGLDRLHTFVVKFFRTLCEDKGLNIDRSAPLNGLVGAYIKKLRESDQLGSDMTERILKSSIANLEAFNHVRNNHTLAHDNSILSYDEALLIFNHVASTVRFVKAHEARLKIQQIRTPVSPWNDEVPF